LNQKRTEKKTPARTLSNLKRERTRAHVPVEDEEKTSRLTSKETTKGEGGFKNANHAKNKTSTLQRNKQEKPGDAEADTEAREIREDILEIAEIGDVNEGGK